MKKTSKLTKEIEEAKNWIKQNKIFVAHLSKNEIIHHGTGEIRKMNKNELFLKNTWIINNLIEQNNQYEIILENIQLINNQIGGKP